MLICLLHSFLISQSVVVIQVVSLMSCFVFPILIVIFIRRTTQKLTFLSTSVFVYPTVLKVRNLLAFVLFVVYFALALYCIWSPLVRSKFGVVPTNYALVWRKFPIICFFLSLLFVFSSNVFSVQTILHFNTDVRLTFH